MYTCSLEQNTGIYWPSYWPSSKKLITIFTIESVFNQLIFIAHDQSRQNFVTFFGEQRGLV